MLDVPLLSSSLISHFGSFNGILVFNFLQLIQQEDAIFEFLNGKTLAHVLDL
jgi:hypothetical protein